jgi:hypothetical protein
MARTLGKYIGCKKRWKQSMKIILWCSVRKMPLPQKLDIHVSFYIRTFGVSQSNNKQHLHPSSSCMSQRVHEVIKACVSLCCIDIKCFDTVTGYGFVDYSHSLKQTGPPHGNVNVKDLLLNLPPPTTHKMKLKSCASHSSPVFSHEPMTI